MRLSHGRRDAVERQSHASQRRNPVAAKARARCRQGRDGARLVETTQVYAEIDRGGAMATRNVSGRPLLRLAR